MSSHYLRAHRKYSCLTQADVAFLMGQKDYSNLSRCEQGERPPTIEMIITYHLLFDAPLENLVASRKDILRQEISERIQKLLLDLRPKDKIPKVTERIQFLNVLLNRFNNHSPIYEPQNQEDQQRFPFPLS